MPIRRRAVAAAALSSSRWRMFAVPMLVALCAALTTLTARAQLQVDIAGVGATQYPIAIADFAHDAAGQTLADVIRADLTRTGQFRLINAAGAGLAAETPVSAEDWNARGADYLAYGSVTRQGEQVQIQYRLLDTISNAEIDGITISSTPQQLRRNAHRIADRMYEKITGVRGVFSTRIAYVLQASGGRYELQVADADGQNPQVMLRSTQSIISPAWSPDGTRLAYVSFESGKPVIYVQTLATGQRVPVANFKGNNSAPAWSPDGQRLAIALSRDGISQIYTINANGSGLHRVMRSPLIDTEPHYSPDGADLVFTSDRSGSPQIYRVPAGGGEAQRLTFSGNYNISPQLSPDGEHLVYLTRRDGNFRVAVLNLRSGAEQLLTPGPDDESPSFAPNGMQLLYSTVRGGRNVLAVTSLDGRVHQTVLTLNGKVREPAWGPFLD